MRLGSIYREVNCRLTFVIRLRHEAEQLFLLIILRHDGDSLPVCGYTLARS